MYFDIDLEYLDYDGLTFGWRQRLDCINSFEGTRKITELRIVPQQHHPKQAKLISKLAERGRKIIDLSKGGNKAYQGMVSISNPFDSILSVSEKYVDGRIVLDADGWFINNRSALSFDVKKYPYGLQVLVPGEKISKPEKKKRKPSKHIPLRRDDSPERSVEYDPPHDDHFGTYEYPDDLGFYDASGRNPFTPLPPLPSHQPARNAPFDPVPGQSYFPPPPIVSRETPGEPPSVEEQSWTKAAFNLDPEVFCSSVVRGYCLTSKSWAEFQVDKISEINWNDNAFDMLVMSAGRKRLLKALVEEQKNHKAELDDVVDGKGQDLVVLLSGPTGTGKTLTAESIADRLRMPLYALGASQLGDQSNDVEDGLSKVLRLTAKWNAVLLLDEADAFLDKRTNDPESTERNKRVAGEYHLERGEI